MTDIATVTASNTDPNNSNNQSQTVSTFVSCGTTGQYCADGIDNDADGLIDYNDPDCHTDGSVGNPNSYNPNGNETTNNGTNGNCRSGDLDIEARALDNPVRPGDDLEYEITVTNDGNTSCNLDLRARLDKQTRFRDASSGGDESGSETVLWDNFVVPRDDERTVRLTVRVDRDAEDGDVLEMKASIPGHNDTVEVDVRDNGGSSTSSTGSTGARITVSKSADRSTAQPGDVVSYTITVRNLGTTAATNVTIDDIYNSGQLSILDPAGGNVNGSTLRWTLDRVDGNTTRTLRYTARISSSMRNGDVVQNSVSVSGGGTSGNDSNMIRIITQLPQTGVGFGSMTNGSDTTHLQAVTNNSTSTAEASGVFSVLSVIATVIGGLGLGGTIGRKLLF